MYLIPFPLLFPLQLGIMVSRCVCTYYKHHWMYYFMLGCHGVTVRRGSFTVELVSHCFLKRWQLVPAETKPPYGHSSISLSQASLRCKIKL